MILILIWLLWSNIEASQKELLTNILHVVHLHEWIDPPSHSCVVSEVRLIILLFILWKPPKKGGISLWASCPRPEWLRPWVVGAQYSQLYAVIFLVDLDELLEVETVRLRRVVEPGALVNVSVLSPYPYTLSGLESQWFYDAADFWLWRLGSTGFEVEVDFQTYGPSIGDASFLLLRNCWCMFYKQHDVLGSSVFYALEEVRIIKRWSSVHVFAVR